MRVLLARQLLLGGHRYRADTAGVEIPENVEGKKVVTHDEWLGMDSDTGREGVVPLPKDAVLYDDVDATRPVLRAQVRSKTIPPQFPVNPTQSPPPGPTPRDGTASMAIDMVEAEGLVADMDGGGEALTTDGALKKVHEDRAKRDEADQKLDAERAKAEAERVRAASEGTVLKRDDEHRLDQAARHGREAPLKAPDTLSGLHKQDTHNNPPKAEPPKSTKK
jgi:hypothetical protein